MSDNYDKESSGMVCVVSKQAGAVAGTSVVISKKIADCGVKTIAAAKDCLKQPLKYLVPARDKKNRATFRASAIKSRDEQQTGRKKAAKALIAAMESDLAAARRELKKAQNAAEKSQSKLASQLDELKVEKEALITDLEQAKNQASEAATLEGEVKTRVATLEYDLATAQRRSKTSHSEGAEAKVGSISTCVMEPTAAQPIIEKKTPKKTKKPTTAAVTEKQAQAAVFPNATDKIIFTRALSDIAGPDATVRADAAKTMAGIRHELSVKALSTQVGSDTSARVRLECANALTALEMQEGLPALEHALTDEASSVRLAAVWGLYRLAGPESTPALIRMFADNNEEVRRRAATCIGWLSKEELALELLPLLDDNSISVRRAAVEAMSNLRSRQVVSSLIERLNDPVESIRKVVLSAIETITGKKMSKSLPKDQKEIERLIARWQQWRKEQLLG